MLPDCLNADLIGIPGGRAKLQTPALVIDLDIMDRNIAKMSDHVRSFGMSLRPHVKTHKSAEIARRQMAAGALGICCAKLGEAEALAAGGIEKILITSPVVTAAGMARLFALNKRISELTIVCDSRDVAVRLDQRGRSEAKSLRVLVDIDPGMARTGIRIGEDALALVGQVATSEKLHYAGLQCYAGNLQHIESPSERRTQTLSVLKDLADFCDVLAAEGLAPGIVSGGGTGTFDLDPEASTLTELQAGSYVFMDREYNDVWEKSGQKPPFETSLFVQTTVISANREGLATTDAGLKAFATDAGAPVVASGARQGATYFFFGDEQGGVAYGPSNQPLRVGDVLTCIVPHCDPTVNLYDWYHVVRGDTLEAIWCVDARGRSA